LWQVKGRGEAGKKHSYFFQPTHIQQVKNSTIVKYFYKMTQKVQKMTQRA
jgi:hypothetical protein